MIRAMRAGDVGALMRLKQTAAWNQTERDWENVLALQPEGCWVDDRDGEIVASTTAVCYGQELAWIGMVLVLPEWRGRGLARGLMKHCLGWLSNRGLRQVKLDATDMGRPLYRQLGFVEERIIERWGSTGPGSVADPGRGALPIDLIAGFDRECLGADRGRLLRRLIEAFPGQGRWQPGNGFLLGRPGSQAYFLGPGQASSAEAAGGFLRSLMEATGEQAYYWDLFPDHAEAVSLARQLGFEPRRALARMALRPGAGPAGRPERVFAAAGFEYG